jgi:hypothetical protein
VLVTMTPRIGSSRSLAKSGCKESNSVPDDATTNLSNVERPT